MRDADLERLQTAGTVLNQIMSAPDQAIPDRHHVGAKCIAVVPSMLKASFIFGANYGKGVATCRTAQRLERARLLSSDGGSFGFQAGGQASRPGADHPHRRRHAASAAKQVQARRRCLGCGRSGGPRCQAATDLTMRAQVLTYSRARGLFLGVSLSGGVINQTDADTQAFYPEGLDLLFDSERRSACAERSRAFLDGS